MSKQIRAMAEKLTSELANHIPITHEKLVIPAEEKLELENWKREKRNFCNQVIAELKVCKLKLYRISCSVYEASQKNELKSSIESNLEFLEKVLDNIPKNRSMVETSAFKMSLGCVAVKLREECIEIKWDKKFNVVQEELSQIVNRIEWHISPQASFVEKVSALAATSFGCVVEAAGGAGAMSSAASFGETCDESSASKAIRKAKHNKSKKNKKKNGPSTASVTLAASSMAASEDLNLATISSSEKDTLSGRSSSSEEKHSHSFVETLKLERKQSFASISSDSSSDEEVDYHLPPRSYAEKIAASDRRIGESPGLSFLVSQ